MNQQQQQLNDIPERCLAYSANWYMNEISSYDIKTDLFAFGSNSDIYIINYKNKKYEIIIQNTNIREKITCVRFVNINNNNNNDVDEEVEIEQKQNESNIEQDEILLLAGSNIGNIYIYLYNIKNKSYKLLENQNILNNSIVISLIVDQNNNQKQLNQKNNIINFKAILQNGSTFNVSFNIMSQEIINIQLFIQMKYNQKLKLCSTFNTFNGINQIQQKQGDISSTNNNNNSNENKNGCIFFFEEGVINIYENKNIIMSHQIEGKILTIDEIKQNINDNDNNNDIIIEKKSYLMIKKIKNNLFISMVDILLQNQVVYKKSQNKQNEQNQENEDIQQEEEDQENITQDNNQYKIINIIDVELQFIYNKKQYDLMQSSYSIHSINNNEFILTGKIGDIYIFNIQKLYQHINNNKDSINKVIINPLSAQFNDSFYSKVPDSNHYDGIYAINSQNSNLIITLSTDRKISFFRVIDKSQINQDSDQQNENQKGQDNVDNNELIDENNNSDNYMSCQLQFEWQLNCLGGKVNSLAVSSLEKELIYMSCSDHTIRVWDSSKIHDQLYVKDYYKRLDQIKVRQMLLHPTFENIMILLLDDNPKKIIGYDLLKEKITFEYQSNRDILNLKWIEEDQLEELQNIQFEQIESTSTTQNTQNKSNEDTINQDKPQQQPQPTKQLKLENDKIESKEKTNQQQQDNIRLLIFKKGGYSTIINQYQHTINIEDYSLCENKSNVQQFDYTIINNQLFSVFIQLGQIIFYYDYQYKSFQNIHKNIVKSITFKECLVNDQLIICCGSYDRRISVFIGDKQDINSFEFLFYLKNEYPIERIRFNNNVQDNYYLLSICQNVNNVQIYDLNPEKISLFQSIKDDEDCDDDNENEDSENENEIIKQQQNQLQNVNSFEFKNIRGHRGYINDAIFSPLDPKLVITCSDDQTVKFWNLDKIINKSYPKRKKNRNNNKGAGQNEENDGGNHSVQDNSNQKSKMQQKNLYGGNNRNQQNNNNSKFSSNGKKQYNNNQWNHSNNKNNNNNNWKKSNNNNNNNNNRNNNQNPQ